MITYPLIHDAEINLAPPHNGGHIRVWLNIQQHVACSTIETFINSEAFASELNLDKIFPRY